MEEQIFQHLDEINKLKTTMGLRKISELLESKYSIKISHVKLKQILDSLSINTALSTDDEPLNDIIAEKQEQKEKINASFLDYLKNFFKMNPEILKLFTSEVINVNDELIESIEDFKIKNLVLDEEKRELAFQLAELKGSTNAYEKRIKYAKWMNLSFFIFTLLIFPISFEFGWFCKTINFSASKYVQSWYMLFFGVIIGTLIGIFCKKILKKDKL